eukprot:COSAG01_NODE_2604_length_7393_cov_11.578146_1_plen_45_part_10
MGCKYLGRQTYSIQQQKNDLLCFPISAKSQVFCRSAQIVKTKLAS